MKTKLFLLVALFFTLLSVNAQVNGVALVGEAAGGWPGDPGNPGPADVHQMTSTDGVNWTLSAITLTTATSGGGVKFRANNAWAINWGNAAFPNGTGTAGGANILSIAGTYDVMFNSTTGVYSFAGGTPIATINIIGTSTGGTPLTMTTTDAVIYTYTGAFVAGGAQFEINDNVQPTPTTTVVGGTAFPSGTVTSAADNIPVSPAGNYVVTVNTGSGDYSFAMVVVVVNPKIAIVGNATTGGWPNDPQVDTNEMLTSDGEKYKLNNLLLVPGDLKFRQDNGWTNAWGGTAFPVGTPSGSNLTVAAGQGGNYRAKFIRSTGAYTFEFPTVAIVGEAVGGWPGDPGNPGPLDTHQLTTTDGETYTITNLVITTATVGGGAKFRWDNAWADNSGGASFPTVSASNGDNIPTTAGTYDGTFTRSTGAYSFTPALAVTSFETSGFKVFPNPTQNTWSFSSSKDAITNIQIADLLGKIVVSTSQNTIDASGLTTGVYFAKVSTEKGSATVKVVRN